MKPTIAVILGSTREGRFGEKPANWIYERLQQREDLTARLLDLRDFPMPFFDAPKPPGAPREGLPYGNEVVQRWTAEIGAADGFVFVTPEYNHGPPAVLKNAIDWVYPEWNRKPAAFVAWGSALGARAVQQLREVAIEVKLAPLRAAVHVPVSVIITHRQGADTAPGFAQLEGAAKTMIDELMWWTEALKRARSS